MKTLLALAGLVLVFSVNVHAQTGPCPGGAPLAFEGAEGFGRCAQGGRGGVVVDVTNLNNSGTGSLRECAEVMSGPRSCRIMVAGTIELVPPGATTADILITNPFLTIDGASAPSGGIALKNGGLSIMASHVIVRHLRVRPGLKSAIERGSNANGITVMSNGSVRTTDVIVDHCSVSWTSDDSVSVVYGADRITFQWLLISDSVSHTGDPRGKHFLMGYQARSVSFHHNLGAHGFTRWPEYSGGGPSAGGEGQLDFVNNLNYNGSGTDTMVDPHHGPSFANFVGNYWQRGIDAVPANDYPSIKLYHALPYSAQSGVHVANNYGRYWGPPGSGTLLTGVASPDHAILNNEGSGSIAVSPTRYPYPQITTTDPVTARIDILANAGAFPRDSYDTRIISDVTSGTGRRITNGPAQVGPWPILTNGGTPPPVVPPPIVPSPVPPSPVVPPPPVPSAGFGVTTKTETKVIVEWKDADCPGGVTNTRTGTATSRKITVVCKP